MCSVKSEMHTVSAGRDTYYWTEPCMFFQWIDGPDKFDPRIRLFSYDKDETKPLNEFKRWVPPPPNPPPMTMRVQEASDIIILIDDVIVSVRTVFYRLVGSWRLH